MFSEMKKYLRNNGFSETFPSVEVVAPEVFCEKVFLEISQNSQEKTCPRVSFLIKLQAWGLQLC